MTTTQLKCITPLETPLPPPATGEVLTEAQWTTLLAIADTIIPSIEVSTSPSKQKLSIQASEYTNAVEAITHGSPEDKSTVIPHSYLQENASSIPGFKELLRRTLSDYVREDARRGIRVILSALKYGFLMEFLLLILI